MRILLAASVRYSQVTGVPRQMRALAHEFGQLGHEVHCVFMPPTARWRPSANSLRFSCWILPRLLRAALQRRYDAFILHSSDGWLYGLLRRLARPLLRTPYVMASHGLEHRFWKVCLAEERAGRLRLSKRHKLFSRLVRLPLAQLAVRTCDRLICLTHSERSFVTRRRWKQERDIAVIYNGVGTEYFEYQAALEAPLWRLVYVGPWTWNKGRRLITSAFAELASAYPELRLALLGTGVPAQTVLADFPAEIRPRIRLVERIPPAALPEELAKHHIFLFPSLFEGGPLSLLEAMATGLAVIACNCYAMAEIVKSGSDGLLVPAGDPVAFREAIRRLIEHPEEARRLGVAARNSARERSWVTAAHLTSELLLSAMKDDLAGSEGWPASKRNAPDGRIRSD